MTSRSKAPPSSGPAPASAAANGAGGVSKPWEHAKGTHAGAGDPVAARFVESLSYDTRLYRADIIGSIAHARMLESVGLITRSDLEAIERGLEEIRVEIEAAGVTGWSGWKVELEDVHMCIESALIAKVGDPGRKLHTGRSRNDQVALDLRIWLREAAGGAADAVHRLRGSLAGLAARQGEIVIPGYTHMQRAQPVTVGAEVAAWCAMLGRDEAALRACMADVDECPLGSGALAGSSLTLDRAQTAAVLGFTGPSDSSIDSTASRDEALDLLYALARTAMHLSRWAEQWILYCTTEFGFLTLDPAHTTGSSMMPQKRNPDMLELIRGRCGGVYGHLMALLTICKGLPIGYNRDLQEDKRHLFAAFDTVMDSLEMASRVADGAAFDQERIRLAGGGLERGFLDATALAERLVTAGVPFRTAHQIVGEMVHLCDSTGRTSLRELRPDELASAVRGRGIDSTLLDPSGVIAGLGAERVAGGYRTHGHAGSGPRGAGRLLLGPDASAPAVAQAAPPGSAQQRTRRAAPVEPVPDPRSVPSPAPSATRPKMPVLKPGGRSGSRVATPIGPIQHGPPPPMSEPEPPVLSASLFGSGAPAPVSGDDDLGATVSQFNQGLIAAYVEVGRTLDDLPYTEDFLRLCVLANAHEAGMNEQAVFRRLQNIRKAGRLPPIGRATGRAPRISEAEEQWLRQAVEETVGSLGQRDQLPFTPRFDALLERFNQASGRSMDPHDLWRIVAKIAK